MLRNRFQVKDLTSSKYTVVKKETANLDPEVGVDGENQIDVEDDVQDADHIPLSQDSADSEEANAGSSRGILVSAPLYAGIRNFPQHYLAGAKDARDFSFVLAYNAHGLTKKHKPVEDAVDAAVADPYFRGVALGFYWEQEVYDTKDNKNKWTDNLKFIGELNKATNDPNEQEAFAKSLRHESVLGTFPYGMWRNIAMNTESINTVMDSGWGQQHAPVMAHVTDPDATTWVDPFSKGQPG